MLHGLIIFRIVEPNYKALSFIAGFYVPCVFIALGVIGNVICLSILCCKRRNTPYGTYISYLMILNIVSIVSLNTAVLSFSTQTVQGRH